MRRRIEESSALIDAMVSQIINWILLVMAFIALAWRIRESRKVEEARKAAFRRLSNTVDGLMDDIESLHKELRLHNYNYGGGFTDWIRRKFR